MILAAVFARAASVYWTGVFPKVSRELRRWRASACTISDPLLRLQALDALGERGNMEGAAAFATFVPRERRDAIVRATVAFQAAYNHLDVLSEYPVANGADPFEHSRRMHHALLQALDPTLPIESVEDDGYLAAMVSACRAALRELPSYEAVRPAAIRAAERVVGFQAHQASGQGTDAEAMERWARSGIAPDADLRWWEAAGAAGSSLGVHVMIALAAERAVDPALVGALEAAYFPWIGALHSLLDHLVDVQEDARSGQRNLIGLYDSPEQAAQRMRSLAEWALQRARALPFAPRHELIVSAMACFYLSRPQARFAGSAPVAEAVLEVLGPSASAALTVFKARDAVGRLYYPGRANDDHHTAAQTLALASPRR